MLASARDPIIATATASGRGAVGIVRLSGLGLTPLAQALCGQTLLPRVATLTPFLDAEGQPIDTGLALFFPAPHSYTGEDVLELQAHGGPVLLQLLLARCLALASEGLPQTHNTPHSSHLHHLRLARPGEFTERAYLNGKLDLAQAEAVADLIDASTEAAARSAQRSLSGAFSHEVTRLQEALTYLRMWVEATLDFPEEELDFLQQADAQGQLKRLRTQLAEVLARTQQGALLREGIRVVIAGQPNAGKSSLLNALAGAELAIVTPIAGTTRDVLRQTIQIEGVPLHVVDTAGLRQTDQAGVDAVEKIGIQRAWTQIAQADAVLWVRDATRLQDAQSLSQDRALEQSFQSSKVPVLEIWNKCDLRPELTSSARANTRSANAGAPVSPTASAPIPISAQTGEGLQTLRRALLELAGWQPQSEGLYLARQRHVQALQAVAQHLGTCEALLQSSAPALDVLAEELRLSQNALSEITGSMSSDDLLGVIFSRFCIGK